MFVRELLFLSQFTTTSIYTESPSYRKNEKCDFVNFSVVINSFFLDYWYHVSHLIHLIFESCYVRDTYCSRHFNFAIFLYREIREINVSR